VWTAPEGLSTVRSVEYPASLESAGRDAAARVEVVAVTLPRVALALALTLSLGAGVARATPPTDVTHVLAAPCVSSVTVPADYVGLSIEWSMVQRWFGTSRLSAVQPTADLLKTLHAEPGGGVLRIGGNSQDGYRFDAHGTTDRNTLFTGTITPGMVDALFEVARRSGWRVILGLNLRADRPDEAVALARYAVQQDRSGNLLSFEIGNEPNGYFAGDITGYVARVGRYLEALGTDPATRLLPISGPSLSNQADLTYLTALEQAYGARMRFLTWHHYANRPTLSRLLEEEVITQWTDRIAAVAQAAGPTTPTRMDEGNSVGHGGMDRVSNVTGTTAWLVDSMLTGAVNGLGGYNVHAWDEHYYPGRGWTARYTPFVVRDRKIVPRAPVYAMALLRDLGGKRLCRATTANSDGEVKAWSLTDPDTGRRYVYLVNKSQVTRAATVDEALAGNLASTATISRITDPGGCAGKSTGINTNALASDGTLAARGDALAPDATGQLYDVELQPCQSVVIELAAGT